MNNEKIIEYIEKNPQILPGKTRAQTYARYYLFSLLRESGLTYVQIGDILNKNHSTVIHGIRLHDIFEQAGDRIYLDNINHLRILFKEPLSELNLEQDILNCTNLRSLGIIKARIRAGSYSR
jgi:hypothetical protein